MSMHFQGVGGAPGIVIGYVMQYTPHEPVPIRANESPEAALLRFRTAQHEAATQLTTLADQLHAEGRVDEAAIIATQALFVEDVSITDDVTRRLVEHHEPLERALEQSIAHIRASFETLDDPYFAERAADIDAIGRMLRATLRGISPSLLPIIPPDTATTTILLAPDLTPAETAGLRRGTIGGFATAYGSINGHTAILARSLGIPAVVGLGEDILSIPNHTEIILDGNAHLVIVNPSPIEQTRYKQRMHEHHRANIRRQALRAQPGQMADGHPVALLANIGHPDEVRPALEYGAEGIGLFRTEFLFLDRSSPPSEQEQYECYRSMLDSLPSHTVMMRTLDIGGDKTLPYISMPNEVNPFLGIRGLRLCMHHPHLLTTQLRALLRAAVHGNLSIMFPMITTPADLAWGQNQVRLAAESLEADRLPYRKHVPLGIMVETPAAAITTDLLARDAAFISIGSNDLTQYTMAADRRLAELSAAYSHDSPAVLRLIAQVITVARAAHLPASVCGEMAGIPDMALILAGFGATSLSMAPAAIPLVKERLNILTFHEAHAAAQRIIAPIT